MASGRNTIDGLMTEYDRIIDLLIKRLRNLLISLGNERARIKDSMRVEIQQISDAKKREFENKKLDFENRYTFLGEKYSHYRITKEEELAVMNRYYRIQQIEQDIKGLLEEEIKLSEQENTTLANEEKILNDDIAKVSKLLGQIEQRIAGRKGFAFKIFGKSKNAVILTPAELKQIYERIVIIYQDLEKRGKEEDIIRTRIEPLKKQIEAKAKDIINRLEVNIKGGTTPT